MPLFAIISSCNMLFDSSKHCNLTLFLQSLNYYYLQSCHVCLSMFYWFLEIAHCSCFVMIYLYIMPMPFFSCWGPVACFLMLARCLVAVLDSLSFKHVSCVRVEPLLRFECALYETCLKLHVPSYYHVASLFWCVCLMFGCILHQCHA